MEAGKKEEDPFSSMIKLCHPTSSQESILSHCPLARESEILVDPNSSSPDPTPSPPTPVVMVSPPDSSDAVPEVDKEEESDAVFHTPPEHHLRSSSSEEQNFVDCGDESKRVRVSQRGSENDGSIAKKVRVSDLDSTEEIVIEETESVHDTEVINLDSEETVNLGEEVVMVDKIVPEAEIGGEGVDSIGENHEMEIDGKAVEDIEVNEGEKHIENSDVDGSCGSGKTEEIVRIKRKEESAVGGPEKLVLKVTEARENSDGGLRANVKSSVKFVYAGEGDVGRRLKGRTGIGGGGGKVHRSPESVKGKEKNVGGSDVMVNKIDPVAEIVGEGVDSVGEKIDGKYIVVNEVEHHIENRDEDENCGSGKIEEEIIGIKLMVSDKCTDTRKKSGVGGPEKVVVKVSEARENSDGGLKTNVKSSGKFAFLGEGDSGRRLKGRTCKSGGGGGGGRGRQLPLSVKGKEKNVGGSNVVEETGGGGGGRMRQSPISVKGKDKNAGGSNVVEENAKTKKMSGLLDLLNVLKVVVGDKDGGSEDVDFLETAKKRGVTFPRPRWWPPEGEDKDIFG